MDQHEHQKATVRIGRETLTITLLREESSHMPRYGRYSINSGTTGLFYPPSILRQILPVLDPLLREFKNVYVIIDDIVRAVKIADKYKCRSVSIIESSNRPESLSSYRITSNEVSTFNLTSSLQSDKSLEENAELLSKMILDQHIIRALAELRLK